ncbi:MAG: hypothetical protein WCG48_02785 [Candidatus Berkelbacteria bacterium]
MNKALTFILVAVGVIILSIVLIFSLKNDGKTTGTNTERVFYYGSTCPHCKLVEEFIKNNNVKAKYDFTEKEVYGSKTNADELIKRGTACGLDKDSIGAVPMFWDNGTCILGDQPIIDLFKKQIGVTSASISSSSSSTSSSSSSTSS